MPENHEQTSPSKEGHQKHPILDQDFYCIWCGLDFDLFDYFMKDITIEGKAYIHKSCLLIFQRDFAKKCERCGVGLVHWEDVLTTDGLMPHLVCNECQYKWVPEAVYGTS